LNGHSSQNHVYDEHNNALAIYWKKGVNVVKWLAEHSGDAHLQLVKQNAERHAKLMGVSDSRAESESALFDDEEDGSSEHVNISFGDSQQAGKSAQKAAPTFEGVEVTKTGHHVQTVRELQTVPVIVSADMTKSPPVIKVSF
jgi:protein SSD1